MTTESIALLIQSSLLAIIYTFITDNFLLKLNSKDAAVSPIERIGLLFIKNIQRNPFCKIEGYYVFLYVTVFALKVC